MVTAQLISAYVFATHIVKPFYFLNQNFEVFGHLLKRFVFDLVGNQKNTLLSYAITETVRVLHVWIYMRIKKKKKKKNVLYMLLCGKHACVDLQHDNKICDYKFEHWYRRGKYLYDLDQTCSFIRVSVVKERTWEINDNRQSSNRHWISNSKWHPHVLISCLRLE